MEARREALRAEFREVMRACSRRVVYRAPRVGSLLAEEDAESCRSAVDRFRARRERERLFWSKKALCTGEQHVVKKVRRRRCTRSCDAATSVRRVSSTVSDIDMVSECWLRFLVWWCFGSCAWAVEEELGSRRVWCGLSGLCARVVGGRRVGLRRGGRATGIVSSRRSRGRHLLSVRGPLNGRGGSVASMTRRAAELPAGCGQHVCTECGCKIEGVPVCSASDGVASPWAGSLRLPSAWRVVVTLQAAARSDRCWRAVWRPCGRVRVEAWEVAEEVFARGGFASLSSTGP